MTPGVCHLAGALGTLTHFAANVVAQSSPRGIACRRVMRHGESSIGLLVLVLIVLGAIVAVDLIASATA
jgi:hypothetical protein